MKTPMRVGIIGAGAAGLSAAYRLLQMGFAVEVFESAPFVGGQASTVQLSGGRVERGYHHVFKSDVHLINLMQELGIAQSLEWRASSVGSYVKGKLYRTGTPLDLLRFSPLSFLDRLKLGTLVLRLRAMRDWRSLEDLTAEEWLRTNLGDAIYETLWLPLLRAKFGEAHSQIGMAWFWSKIQTRFASRNRMLKEVLGYPRNSFDEVFEVLQQRIVELGGRVNVNTPIVRIISENNKAVGMRFKPPDSEEQTVNFDFVLATVPSFTLAKLAEFSKPFDQKLNDISYLGAVVLILALKEPLTDLYWTNITDSEIPFLGLIEHTNLVPKDWYGGNHILYITNYARRDALIYSKDPEELLKMYTPYLTRFNPKFSKSWITEWRYNSLSAAQPVVCANYSNYIPDNRTPIRRLYLANTSQIYPEDRGVNYSIKLGETAAGMIKEDLLLE